MNRKIPTIAAIAFGLLGLSVATVHADPTVEADCQTITVTAQPGTRVIVGPDGEPPYEVIATTATFNFNPHLTYHNYTIQVLDLTTGGTVSFSSGQVTDCAAAAYPPQPTDDPFPVFAVAEPVVPVVARLIPPVVVTELDLSNWHNVALAPPW